MQCFQWFSRPRYRKRNLILPFEDDMNRPSGEEEILDLHNYRSVPVPKQHHSDLNVEIAGLSFDTEMMLKRGL
jgi:hypothetical protein